MDLSNTRDSVLIASLTPYFLEKGQVWFEQNLQKILTAARTQAFFQDNILFLEKDQAVSLSEVLRRLDEFGYEKVLRVEQMGEFSTQGGLLSFFPINMNNAVRLEFVGNRIDTIENLLITIEDEQKAKDILKKRLRSQKIFSDLGGLKEGDYLVHLDHGVARFAGYTNVDYVQNFHDRENSVRNYYALEYAQGDKLFIPVGLERKLSRYIGFSEPHISRLGSLLWQKTKKKAKEEIEKVARELLELYAKREVAIRPPYAKEDDLEERLRATFPYTETPDQIQTLEEIAQDLEKEEPMDRLVCGDVGFGKTEVALRAMVRAVKNGHQAALLAPTTILAHQHYHNFKDRLKDLPIELAMLSRIQSKREQKQILEKIAKGNIDIVVGTHRLLSRDVAFKNLGLLVIDDEQRFGVKQKENFKEMRAELDVLSLSATPIPRTLYMALSSLKNISTIQTPPEGRLPVHTTITKRKDSVIKEAVEKELQRKGQVYYLHNRIGTIEQVKKYIARLTPKANIEIVHGRMKEKQLIRAIDDFRAKKFDILLATTIIESGLDLPSVGTLVVDDATKLGLSQAYQLKGRVGRSRIQSYAHFLYGGKLVGKAKLRLKALKESEELGSGYKIALRDMEIRGAGNLLGKEQAGTVNTVGLNLYCQMLSESVEKYRTASS